MSNSYVRVPPDSSGKRIFAQEHTIGGNLVQVQTMNLGSGDDPTNLLNIDSQGAIYTRFSEGDPIIASYGDLKVLQEYIVGVYEHSIDGYDDLFYTDTLSGGTSTYDATKSRVVLAVTSDNYSKSCRTTNRYHYYQPGTSMLNIFSVSCGDTGKANNRRQWGIFSDEYGLFFELSGTTLNVVQRSNTTGTVIDDRISQDSWNLDKLNGSGRTGVFLNVTENSQYFISLNWPAGQVIFGIFDAELGRVPCHKIRNSGISAYPIIKHASLPVRFCNENIGLTSGSSELSEIMAAVKCENQNPQYTFWRFGDLNCVGKTVTTNTPILSVRPKVLLDSGKHNHINSYPETLSVYSSGASIKIQIVSHDGNILTGETWSLNSIGGPLEADSGATLIDTGSDEYWIMNTIYVKKDEALNFDLSRYFELNDEGILLAGDLATQNSITFVGTTLDGSSATVSMDFSYRALY